MARQGLMDDCGHDFFDVSDCANYESCREDAFNDGYEKGRADGYSQAENDYHKQTEKDRQSSYDCGYAKGKADMLDKIIQAEKNKYYCVEDLCNEGMVCSECRANYLERLKEQK